MMIFPGTTLPLHVALVATGLSPQERWSGIHDYAASHTVNPWWLAFCLLAGVVACVAAVLIYRRFSAHVDTRSRVTRQAKRLGLTPRQREIMETLARLSGLRDSAKIFTMSQAFDEAVTAMMALPRFWGMDETTRHQIGEAVHSLRGRLGFAKSSEGASENGAFSTRRIPLGSRLVAVHTNLPDGVEAVADLNDALGIGLRIDPPLAVHPQETIALQYVAGSSAWEFAGVVAMVRDGLVVIGHTSQARLVNRRRFVRVPVHRPAAIALLPFHGNPDAGSLELVEGELTEIAGPGACVLAAVKAHVGQRVIVALWLRDDEAVQSCARVRRVEDRGEGKYLIAVEMTDLTAEETSELVCQTNNVQRTVRAAAIARSDSNG